MAANRGAVERFEDTIEDILLYLRHGFSIFEELNRNSFTNDSNVAEILIIRCEEFVCGLSLLYRLVQWPVDITLDFSSLLKNHFECSFVSSECLLQSSNVCFEVRSECLR